MNGEIERPVWATGTPPRDKGQGTRGDGDHPARLPFVAHSVGWPTWAGCHRAGMNGSKSSERSSHVPLCGSLERSFGSTLLAVEFVSDGARPPFVPNC